VPPFFMLIASLYIHPRVAILPCEPEIPKTKTTKIS